MLVSNSKLMILANSSPCITLGTFDGVIWECDSIHQGTREFVDTFY